jgi:hypothetical protein
MQSRSEPKWPRTAYNFLLFGVLLFLGLPARSSAQVVHTFVEDFSTTVHRAASTTAVWDTVGHHVTMTSPELMTIAAVLPCPGAVRDLSIAPNQLVVATTDASLLVATLSSPDSSQTVNVAAVNIIPLPAAAEQVETFERYAVAACGDAGIVIVDLAANPAPAVVASAALGTSVHGFCVVGSFAYCVGSFPGVKVLRLDALPNITLVFSSPATVPGLTRVEPAPPYLLASSAVGLNSFDISTPGAPTYGSAFTWFGPPTAISVEGHRALVGFSGGVIALFNLHYLPSLQYLRSESFNPPISACAMEGNYGYVAEATGNLRILDLRSETLVLSRSIPTPSAVTAIAPGGSRLYVGYANSEVAVFTTQDLYPVDAGQGFGYLRFVEDVELSWPYLYVAAQDGLYVIPASDPTAMGSAQVGYFPTPDRIRGIAVAQNHVFAASDYSGVWVVSVVNPLNPTLVSAPYLTGRTVDIALAGHLALVANSELGLAVLDVSNPAAPALLGHAPTAGTPLHVATYGRFAVLASGSAGVEVFSVAQPTNPEKVGGISSVMAYDAACFSHFALVATGGAGSSVIDLADPSNPTVVGQLVGVSGQRVSVSGSYGLCGSTVIDLTSPTSPRALASLPYASTTPVTVSGDYAMYGGNPYWEGFRVVYLGPRFPPQNASETVASTAVVQSPCEIARYRQSAICSAGISWQTALGVWHSTSGNQLSWNATLYRPSTYSINWDLPSITQVSLDWMSSAPSLARIADVPNDQGGWARVTVTRSGRDFQDGSGVLQYFLMRRVDAASLRTALRTAARSRAGGSRPHTSDGTEIDQAEPSFPADSVEFDGHQFLVTNGGDPCGPPAGVWEFVGSAPALRQELYLILAPTIADSTAGAPRTVFCALAFTVGGNAYYSLPDSGYSYDNIAPAAPQGLVANYHSGGVALSWSSNQERDFQYFRVYRSIQQNPPLVPSNVVAATTTASWEDVLASPWEYHYRVTTVDHAGNESQAADPGVETGSQTVPLPIVWSLSSLGANPSSSWMGLAVDVPAATDRVDIQAFDLRGRSIADVFTGALPPGHQVVRWDGRDRSGRSVASGIYVVRLQHPGGRTLTTKVCVVR